jgi:hypothetical protein
MGYLSMKMGRTQRKEEDARLKERLMALQLPVPSKTTRTQHSEDANADVQDTERVPRAIERGRSTRRTSKPRIVNVESQTQGIMGPPMHLSSMIQRAPESIRTPTPLPEPEEPGPSDSRHDGSEDVERVPRQEHSGSSLGNRLRQTQLEDLPLRSEAAQLEDLPLRSEAAQEIRNLMLDLARDQSEPTTTTTNVPSAQHSHGLLPSSVSQGATPPTGHARDEVLPGGFSRQPEIVSTPSHVPHTNTPFPSN